MRILIACRGIDGVAGGVERMSIALMNALCAKGHEVHFFTLDQNDAKPFYEMDPRISWHKLDMGDYQSKAGWWLRIRRALAGRKYLKKVRPDVAIGFQDGPFLQMRFYGFGLGIPTILAERIAPNHFDFIKAGKYRWFFYNLYRMATRITVQCPSYISEYPKYLQPKIAVIPNPVESVKGKADPAGEPGEIKRVLCVGRIGYQKNQKLLIDVFAKLAVRHPDWRLVLAGGDQVEEARKQIEGLMISDRVEILGAVKDVALLYQTSHLFCLPSRWEGFPNALAEAMAYGLPAVGFGGCGGVRDLIIHGETGLLAPGNENPRGLREVLEKLMSDSKARQNMGQKGREYISEFKPEAIFDQWEKLFNLVSA